MKESQPSGHILSFMQGRMPANEQTGYLKQLAEKHTMQRELLLYEDERTRSLWASLLRVRNLPGGDEYRAVIHGWWVVGKHEPYALAPWSDETQQLVEWLKLRVKKSFTGMVKNICKEYKAQYSDELEKEIKFKTLGVFLKKRERGDYEEQGRADHYFLVLGKTAAKQIIKSHRNSQEIPSDEIEGSEDKGAWDPKSESDIEAQDRQQEENRLFKLCIDELKELDQDILKMRYTDRLKPEAIAKQKGLTPRQVTVHLQEIKIQLTKCCRERQCASLLGEESQRIYQMIFVDKMPILQCAEQMQLKEELLRKRVKAIKQAVDTCVEQKNSKS